MCIIIANKKNSVLDLETLQTSCDYNDDSFGLCYVHKGRFVIYKTLKKKQFIDKYYKIRELFPSKNIMLHCRISTHGKSNLQNCHPFQVNKSVVFSHNGIIQGYTAKANNKISDTRVFMNEVLKTLPEHFYNNATTLMLLSDFIGSNKLCFLDIKGDFHYVNRNLGTYDKNQNWYSNETYKNYAVYAPYKSKTVICQDCEVVLFNSNKQIGYCDACLKGCSHIDDTPSFNKNSPIDDRLQLDVSESIIDYVHSFQELWGVYVQAIREKNFALIIRVINENFIYTTSQINLFRLTFDSDIKLPSIKRVTGDVTEVINIKRDSKRDYFLEERADELKAITSAVQVSSELYVIPDEGRVGGHAML